MCLTTKKSTRPIDSSTGGQANDLHVLPTSIERHASREMPTDYEVRYVENTSIVTQVLRETGDRHYIVS